MAGFEAIAAGKKGAQSFLDRACAMGTEGQITMDLLSPGFKNLLDPGGYELAGGNAIQSIRQQLVVPCVVVSNSSSNRQGQSLFLEISASLRPPYPAAPPRGGVFGDGSDLAGRTAGEQH